MEADGTVCQPIVGILQTSGAGSWTGPRGGQSGDAIDHLSNSWLHCTSRSTEVGVISTFPVGKETNHTNQTNATTPPTSHDPPHKMAKSDASTVSSVLIAPVIDSVVRVMVMRIQIVLVDQAR